MATKTAATAGSPCHPVGCHSPDRKSGGFFQVFFSLGNVYPAPKPVRQQSLREAGGGQLGAAMVWD